MIKNDALHSTETGNPDVAFANERFGDVTEIWALVSGRTRQVSLFTCDAQKDGVCFCGKNDDVFSKTSTLAPSVSDVNH